MSTTTVAVPVVADERRHTWARTSPIAAHNPARTDASMERNVRYSVESDGTDPNKSGCERRCSMSAHASPPPASMSIAWVMQRDPLTGDRDARRQRITQPQAVPKRAKSMQPDMSDDLLAAPFHYHRDRAVTVHLASALQGRVSDASTTSESLVWRALPRMGSPSTHRSA